MYNPLQYMKYKTKVVFSGTLHKWLLVDSDGYLIGGYSSPSKARKAKLYWWLYLTLDKGHMEYLDKMADLGGNK